MRLQAIKKRCLASRQLIIINGDDGAQWISDGANAYAIVGIRIRESFIQDVFGLSEKQMDRLIIRTETRPGPLYRETASIIGEELEEMRTVWAYDQKIYALYAPPPTRSGSAAARGWHPEDAPRLVAPAEGSGATAIGNADGILYVPEDAILAACKPEDWITYQLTRDERGRLLVAIVRGMFCEALLSPVTDDIADDISDKLRKVGNMPILRTTIREEDDDEEAVN